MLKSPAWGHPTSNVKLAAVLSYVVGALLYLVSGILSEAGITTEGTWLWVVGSLWFVIGALLGLLGAGKDSAHGSGETAPLLRASSRSRNQTAVDS